MKCLMISNLVLIIGYSTDENINYLEEKGIGGYISARKLSMKEKKYNTWEKPFQKDNFDYDAEIGTYICHLGEILYRIKIPRLECNGMETVWVQKIYKKRLKRQYHLHT